MDQPSSPDRDPLADLPASSTGRLPDFDGTVLRESPPIPPLNPHSREEVEALSRPSNPLAESAAETLSAELGRERSSALLERARAWTQLNAGRPGGQTTEFKLSIAATVAGLALAGFGQFAGNPEMASQGVDLVKFAVAGYAVSRGISKAGASREVKS